MMQNRVIYLSSGTPNAVRNSDILKNYIIIFSKKMFSFPQFDDFPCRPWSIFLMQFGPFLLSFDHSHKKFIFFFALTSPLPPYSEKSLCLIYINAEDNFPINKLCVHVLSVVSVISVNS